MKKHNQLIKAISLLMTFIILIQLSGCYATRTVKSADLTNLPDQFKYNYIIHTDSTKFQIFSVSLSDGKLSGTKSSIRPMGGNSVHVYLSAGTILNPDQMATFKVNMENISKIEIKESNVAGTVVLGIFGLIAIIGIIGLLTFHIDAGWNGI